MWERKEGKEASSRLVFILVHSQWRGGEDDGEMQLNSGIVGMKSNKEAEPMKGGGGWKLSGGEEGEEVGYQEKKQNVCLRPNDYFILVIEKSSFVFAIFLMNGSYTEIFKYHGHQITVKRIIQIWSEVRIPCNCNLGEKKANPHSLQIHSHGPDNLKMNCFLTAVFSICSVRPYLLQK